MRHIAVFAALASLAACGRSEETKAPEPGQPAAALDARDVPKLRSGLWRMSVGGAPGAAGEGSLCVDETVQEQMNVLAGPPDPACTSQGFTARAGGGYSTRTVCNLGEAGTRVSQGVITGDFDTTYRTETTVTVSGAASEAMNSTLTMTSTFTYAGDCPAGMKPGDLDMGGVRMNLADLADPSVSAPAP